MRKIAAALGTLAVVALPALAAEDPIAARQALMSNNGAAAGVAGGIMKGELEYSPVVGRAVIQALAATAATYGDYFPEGSLDESRSRAAPIIWEDMEGFLAELEEYRTAVASAQEVSGRDGPPDQAAFGSAMQPVFDTCTSCHETYRLEE